MLVAALVAATLLTACGGGGNRSLPDTVAPIVHETTTTPAPLPKPELIKQADAICDETNRLLKGYGRPEAGPGIIGTFRQVSQYLRTQLGKLEALPATPADKAVLQQHLIDTTRRKLGLVDTLVARAEAANGDIAALTAAQRDFFTHLPDTRPDDAALVAYGYRTCVNANL